jgi:MFS transporter, SP family, general alpha glucoside:H+ symporter
MCLVLMLIGILNVWTDRKSIALAQTVLTLAWTFIFQLGAAACGNGIYPSPTEDHLLGT